MRSIVLDRFPATLELSFAALIVCIAIAIPRGYFSRPESAVAAVLDRTIYHSLRCWDFPVPNFALGPVLILIFSVEIEDGSRSRSRGGAGHLILPVPVTPGRGAGAGDPYAHGPRFDDRGAFR